MSRIHEALKKAEQERGTGARVDDAPPPVAPPVPVEPEVGVRATGAPRNQWQDAQREDGPIPLATLEERCPHPLWTPAAKIARLMSSNNSAMGTEELRTLRSRLYQLRDREQAHLRKVLITSALPGEGKTFLTASLGHIMSKQHGRNVLLIDTDLRRPQLHATLGAPSVPGLTEYLTGQADPLSIIQHGAGLGIYFIPAGKEVHNPAELLASGLLQKLLDRLAPSFDWVLLDSPPAVPLHDASVLADMCDGVLMVVQAASTPYDVAQKARLELQSKNLIGVVLNQVAGAESPYANYYSYYRGDGSDSASGK